MAFLDDLIAKLREAAEDDAARAEIITAAVQADGVDLAQVSETLAEKSGAVDMTAEDFDPTPEQLEYLQMLAEVGSGVNDEVTRREAEAAALERRETARKLAERIAGTRKPEQAAKPAQKADDGDEGDEGGEGAKAEAGKELVTASGNGKSAAARKIPLGGMRSTGTDKRPVRSRVIEADSIEMGSERYTITASSDGPGVFSGQEFPNFAALANAARDKVQSLSRLGNSSGRAGIATFTRQTPDHLLISEEMRDWHKLESASDERNLPGGSLAAATVRNADAVITAAGVSEASAANLAAWCSPMQILQDLCPLDGSLEGMVDLPTLTTTKGGVMWPQTPDYSAVFKDQPFCFSEADMNATDFAKPCVEVPCQTGWDQCVLEACSFCLIDNILLSRVDDSLTQRAIAQGVYLQRRALNAKRLRQMQQLIGTPTVVSTDDFAVHGPGLVESLLSFVALQVINIRTRRRLAAATTFEMVVPRWLLPLLISDLSKKQGIDNRWDLGEADVVRYFALRGVRLQFVYEFQDAAVDSKAPIGGATTPVAYPDTVTVLLYQAGAFQAIQGPQVSLDAVYDSELLKKNKRVRIFSEDMSCLISRCGEKAAFTLPLCASGSSGGSPVTLANPCDDGNAAVVPPADSAPVAAKAAATGTKK